MNNQKQIVFIEPYPTVMINKISNRFKKKGYKTILIKLLKEKGKSKEYYEESFDQIISFELIFSKFKLKNIHLILFSFIKQLKEIFNAIIKIIKLKPIVFISRATPSWPSAVAIKILRKKPIIYFPYDIRAQVYKTKEMAKKAGLPEFEIKAERYCFENCDGLIHKGAPDELKCLNGRMLGSEMKFPKNILNFHPYASKEYCVEINENKLSKKDKQIHIVYIGSMGNVGPELNSHVLDSAKVIVKQGIHFHMYSKPNSISKEELKDFFTKPSEFTKKYKEVLKSKFFHFHTPLEPSILGKELSKYDYGLWPSSGEQIKNDDKEQECAMGNKLSSFIEAGIPYISHEGLKYITKIGERYRIVVPYNDQNFDQLKKVLKNKNYKELEKNVFLARKDFDIDKQFQRLEKFVKQVIKDKKSSN